MKGKDIIKNSAVSFLMLCAIAAGVLSINSRRQIITRASTLPNLIPEEKEEISSQISPDGLKTLFMNSKINKDNSKTNIFYVDNKPIFVATVSGEQQMKIPYNTWSPGNAYIFLGALVIKADGQSFPDGQKFLNVEELFKAKKTGYNFDEATGWASETLIIFNTTKPDNSKGPSFWFEVPGKAIIQLSTEF